jgi:uncharacterized protein (TIGR02001 family)
MMNKKMIALAAISLGAISASAEEAASPATTPAVAAKETSLSMSSTLGLESKYVFRGVQFADEIFTPAVDLSYGNFYAGAWFAFAEDDADAYPTELDAYAGYNVALSEIVTLDVGATRYAYNRVISDFITSGMDNNSVEFFTGISANVLLSPSAYVYYDIDVHSFTFEVKIGHSFNFSQKVALNLGANSGIVTMTNGEDYAIGCDRNYCYAGVTADLAYSFNDKSNVSVGARYSMSDYDSVYGSVHDSDISHDALWFGASFTAGF